MENKRLIILETIILIIIVGLLVVKLVFRSKNNQIKLNSQDAVQEIKTDTQSSVNPTQSEIPPQKKLLTINYRLLTEFDSAVPFTTQAPTANWDQTHEEACEEAAVLMAIRYFQKKSIIDSADAETGLQEIISWENKTFGYFEDTTAKETSQILTDLFRLKAEVVAWDFDGAKKAVSQGKLILLPTAGRKLKNPHFKQPGPIYHMLLVRGYNKNNQLIVNDAGTKFGEGYLYSKKILDDAVHDWVKNDIDSGKQVMIVVSDK